jgi:large subunit ribosomal protein L32e
MSAEEYKPRHKPVIDDKTKADLVKRNRMSHRRPAFKRQNWFRYKRLGDKWRRPRGIHSKMRRHFKYRIPVAQVGFGGPASVRGLHPSGFEEVRVNNLKEIDNVDPKTQAIRIASTVGDKKREIIVSKADEVGIRVLNRRDL